MEARWALKVLSDQRVKVSSFDDVNDSFELLATSLISKVSRDVMKKHIDRMSKCFKFLSFCENWSSPVMWGHYGDNHRGIVLEFEITESLLEKVNYIGERLHINLEDITTFSGKQIYDLQIKMLTSKYADWAYEKEQRVILMKDEVEKVGKHYFLNFSADFKVTAVIKGIRNESSNKDIQSSKKSPHPLDIFQARNAFKSFQVVENKQFGKVTI